MFSRVCLCATLAAGCGSGTGGASGSGAAPSVRIEPSSAPSVAPAPAPSSGTEIVVVSQPPEAASARFLELDVAPMVAGGAAPRRGRDFTYPSLPHPWHQGRFVTHAAHDGTDVVVATQPKGAEPRLVHRSFGREDERAIELDAGTRPTALLVARRILFVGAGDRVGYVDLAEVGAGFTEVHRRALGSHKAFDLIVQSHDWVVAVDDIVMPMWADSFALDTRGRPTHRAGWELPGVINGHYALGALLGSGGDGSLVLAAPYSIMDGHGHDLALLRAQGHALEPLPARLTLQNARGTTGAPPVLEEHVPRGMPNQGPTLLGGSAYSEWTGMAVLGRDGDAPQLVLAAGARGLMVLPAGFVASTTATVVDVGGACLDVVARGEVLVALVGDARPDPYASPPPAPAAPGPSRIVLVRNEGGGLRVVATHALEAAYTGLVH